MDSYQFFFTCLWFTEISQPISFSRIRTSHLHASFDLARELSLSAKPSLLTGHFFFKSLKNSSNPGRCIQMMANPGTESAAVDLRIIRGPRSVAVLAGTKFPILKTELLGWNRSWNHEWNSSTVICPYFLLMRTDVNLDGDPSASFTNIDRQMSRLYDVIFVHHSSNVYEGC